MALPLNLVIVAAVWHSSRAASEAQRTSLLYTARSVAAAVDAKLGQYTALAQALARSPALLDDNLDAFEAEARRAFASIPDAWVLVANPEGQQLLNTASPLGQPLPLRNPVTAAAQKRAFDTHSIIVTDVLMHPVGEDWIVNIEVPVFRDGQPFRVLAVCLRARLFLRLLNNQQIPENWLACIIDRQGRFIARVPSYEGNAGQLAAEGFRKVKDRDGIFEFLSIEGEPIVTANAHSAAGGWPVAIAVKKAAIQAAAWSTIRWATILAGSLSLISLLFAGAMARRIAGPIAELRQKAGALLTDPASSMPQGPPEVGDLWQALKQSAAERNSISEALRESEARLRLALEAANLGIWRWEAGKGTEEMQWDTRTKALFGLPSGASVTYETWANAIRPEDRAKAEANVARAIDPADPRDETLCEYQVEHPDGTVRWLSSNGRVFFEPDLAAPSGRRAVFMAGAIRNVTEVHLAEAALRESEERLRLANEAAGIGTFTVDVEAGCANYSPELAVMLGFPGIRTVRIEDAFARVHRDDLSYAQTKFEAGLSGAGRGQIKGDFRFVRPGGEIRWMAWAGRVDFRDGPLGRIPFRIAGACVDITERKQAEAALRESEERFRGIYEHAATGIAILDLQGQFQSCNPAYSAMLGFTEDELCRLNFRDLVHPDDREFNMAENRRLLAQEIPSFEILNRYVGKNGKPIWVHKHISLLRDAAGRPTSIIGLITDMTERKRSEEHIRLLLREVNHRSKNMLALVQAVARQTLATKPGDFIGLFVERIQSLAASQDLLVKNEWRGVDLDELARSQLAHFKDLIGTRIELKGPPFLISASAAQAIGMALHELATNAGKYGALVNGDGHVKIEWGLERAGTGEETFVMSWREQGGPSVTTPAHSG
ncbi:MAG: PAS domain S-box protein, partial [Rhodomicrobium sp.]